MELDQLYKTGGEEQPLDRIVPDGGFTAILRRIVCVGDSLSSGEYESLSDQGERGYHDFYEVSWGQFLARMAGTQVLNFSRGGMTAKEYCQNFAQAEGFWDPEKAAQAYLIALGVNDLFGQKQPLGSLADLCREDWTRNGDTFLGWYGQILQRYQKIQPDGKFFLVTMPREEEPEENRRIKQAHAQALYALADAFENTYVIDLFRYGPVYDRAFKEKFYLGGHMNSAGYLLTARMIGSYLDYIIRYHMDDFRQIGFVGTPYCYSGLKK